MEFIPDGILSAGKSLPLEGHSTCGIGMDYLPPADSKPARLLFLQASPIPRREDPQEIDAVLKDEDGEVLLKGKDGEATAREGDLQARGWKVERLHSSAGHRADTPPCRTS